MFAGFAIQPVDLNYPLSSGVTEAKKLIISNIVAGALITEAQHGLRAKREVHAFIADEGWVWIAAISHHADESTTPIVVVETVDRGTVFLRKECLLAIKVVME